MYGIENWLLVFGLTLMAGMAMPAGAALAWIERIRPRWLESEFRHSGIAFGGGALLSAIALVLIPEGSQGMETWFVVFCFSSGAVAFMALDIFLDRSTGPASQLVAMLADFITEALALGATFASGSRSGLLLALIMALQTLPEGFNAFRELHSSAGLTARKIILSFGLLALLGPVAGFAGLFWLAGFPVLISGIMLFSAGGILYLIFQDIAPQAKLKRHWAPPLGANAGFLLGLLGHLWLMD